ncbi:MAG TPA: ribonuclease HII [Anaerolineaceae bacterium]|nr:ribonuclease HII [Anaerolineaceae bacterium]
MTRKNRVILDIPLKPDLSYEQSLWKSGLVHIAGMDEAGRGAWAGPVVAAAVILPPEDSIQDDLSGVRDSKQMSIKHREYWAEKIKEFVTIWGIGLADHAEIDQLGILPATRLAMKRALASMPTAPDHLLIDAVFLSDVNIPQTALIKGDRRCLSIAAASVLAKTTRDEMMREADSSHQKYGFKNHKGYGTRFHQSALTEHGPCPIHRMSFRPLRECSTLFDLDVK